MVHGRDCCEQIKFKVTESFQFVTAFTEMEIIINVCKSYLSKEMNC